MWLNFKQKKVGKYTSPMDARGITKVNLQSQRCLKMSTFFGFEQKIRTIWTSIDMKSTFPHNSMYNDRLGPHVVIMLGLGGGFNPIEKY